MARLLLSALLLAAALPLHAGSIATNSATPLSPRVVDYTIDAKIDTTHKSLDATETLTYHNLTGQTLTTFPFHLYLNGFRPEASFTSETHFGGGIRDSDADDEYPKEKLGSITISHISADGQGDLALHFIAPDDGNLNDHTVAEVKLPHPLAPGGSITFHITFHDQFPLSVARNGYKRDFLMGGQWYPKPGVFWHGAWNCHQYHATTEFFSDFATFHISLTLPKNYIVGASGVPTGDTPQANGTKTVTYYGEDIGDFAWAASPRFQVTTGTYLSSMGPVEIRVLAHASHPHAGPRYLAAAQASMKQFEAWYGPYPYKVLTVVDPEPESEIGGMEYPTLITGDTGNFDFTHETEAVTEHEFGHQYWYGMVATNEFEDAWLDEGINQYTEGNVMAAIYGRNTSFLDLPWASASDYALSRVQYLSAPDLDPVTRHAWQFRDAASYGDITYGKTAMLLKTLEGIIGADTMREAMHVYFMRYRFTHPTTEDFLQTIEEVAVKNGRATRSIADLTHNGSITLLPQNVTSSILNASVPKPLQSIAGTPPPLAGAGSSLRSFFNQAIYGTEVLDYAIDGIDSGPERWWLPNTKQSSFRSTVTIRRRGDFILPVTLEVRFSDGSKLREQWDGADRWKTFTYLRGAKVISAEIDPDHTVWLDKNFFNNSRSTTENAIPARKMATLYASALQLVSQLITWVI
ncbi:M1 family metallopeptidase [Granulicella sp. WH15]|uniref:M1 family metallopeptidase n=1 Tax=Granulicella sp. WH15 TaxID=2602070 RepID=UPI00136797E1|nr:M1 family metallopeptidase [Granulicella sp. WH15]QHN02225.1 M1 family metallopeptidase [Granulicella sp. WH15]